MTILDKIISEKKKEVALQKVRLPLDALSRMKELHRPVLPFPLPGDEAPHIIAEYKRKSPSRGSFAAAGLPVVEVATAYASSGAAAVSVLTDTPFFGGSADDLLAVRKALPGLPLLRKDFIIDPYQVYESRVMGADIVLLIAAVLSPDEVKDLSGLAGELGLHVLLELHDERELDRLCPGISLVGINNRDLRNFSVDTRKSAALLEKLPAGVSAVAESGLDSAAAVKELFSAGFSTFLMGEYFLNSEDPGARLDGLIKALEHE
ncbi:MAG: indole-3-glycerol phosphate synthase TrpC [Bacteroidota bacterium]